MFVKDVKVRREHAFERSILRLVGMDYRWGGRGYGGIDCSSLIIKGLRDASRLTVSALPWMTADQLAKGNRNVTSDAASREQSERCLLAFFDWDEDGIYEHAAVRILDGSWIWSSSTAGKVLRVHPGRQVVNWKRQWREIEGAFDSEQCVMRIANWESLGG